jgi:predicted esterase
MLVGLHGCGDNAKNFLSWAATTFASRPAQSYIAISLGGRDGQCWSLPGDEEIVRTAIEDVRQCFYAHDRKIYIGGYSSGGLLAYQYGLKNAGRFAAILAYNTSIPNRAALLAGASYKVPVVAQGGLSDGNFPPATFRADWSALRAAGFNLVSREVAAGHDGASAHWDDFFIPKIGTFTAP